MKATNLAPCALILLAALLIAGCATFSTKDRCGGKCDGDPLCVADCRDAEECRSECPDGDGVCVAHCQEDLTCISRFYLPYAILAADVYSTRGSSAERFQLIADEQVLKAITKEKDITRESVHKLYEEARNAYRNNKPLPQAKVEEILGSGNEQFVDEIPLEPGQCVEDAKRTQPSVRVPIFHGTRRFGWERVKEMEKYSVTRSWLMFVPELAIEVWRRYPLGQNQDIRSSSPHEYAIVFRGTTGVGGWFSNFRAVTALLPIFWDQYRQAEASAQRIVEQIFMTEFLRAYRHSPDDPRKTLRLPLITLVGHSLGAGLAKYVYFKLPETTRVVAFNPSPIDGGRTLVSLDERASMMRGKQQNPQGHGSDASRRIYEELPSCVSKQAERLGLADPTMFILHERGEVLSSVSRCASGSEWGDEGGPVSLCQEVDLNRGNPIYQHKMTILACKMALKYFEQPPR